MSRHNREAWEHLASTLIKAGAPLLGQAILPGAPMVGRLAGQMASEVLANRMGVEHDDLPAAASARHLAAAARETEDQLQEVEGFHEIVASTKNFSTRELEDHHIHALQPPDVDFWNRSVTALQELRTAWGKPMRLTSAWRSEHHPVEARKPPGALHRHTLGAFDVAIHGPDARDLLDLALDDGWLGIGVNQRGPVAGRFLHLDIVPDHGTIWTY